MNISLKSNGFLNGNILTGCTNGLKSTQEKLKRQAICENKVAFFEAQKENLKNIKGDSLEQIERKLEMFHSYEEEIAAAKQEYNSEQMQHIMDEAEERAEKIAKAAEKQKPKTDEERKDELLEETLGTDAGESKLTDGLEEAVGTIEETPEEEGLSEEIDASELSEAVNEAKMTEAVEDIREWNAVEMQEAIDNRLQYERFDQYI